MFSVTDGRFELYALEQYIRDVPYPLYPLGDSLNGSPSTLTITTGHQRGTTCSHRITSLHIETTCSHHISLPVHCLGTAATGNREVSLFRAIPRRSHICRWVPPRLSPAEITGRVGKERRGSNGGIERRGAGGASGGGGGDGGAGDDTIQMEED